MDAHFWHNSWRENRIGFHQHQVSPFLKKYWSELQLAPNSPVLVPLCGKSLDMLWLKRQGHDVTGVEISSVAIEAFFKENRLEAQRRELKGFQIYEADGITVFCGDFFALTQEQLHPVSAVFDRAALVALPEATRKPYVQHLTALMSRQAKMLLITLDYPKSQMSGPPFSVSRQDVRALFEDSFQVTYRESRDVLGENPRFKQAGLTQLHEHVFLLEKT